jgi:DNA-directed RNA polymerase specialized sigma24 family protein
VKSINVIISELYICKDIERVVNTLPVTCKEDIKQNAFLKLIQVNSSLVLELYNSGKLNAYAYRIIINEFKDFIKKNKESVGIENLELKNEEYEEININFESLEWHETEILKLREQHTLRGIEQLTKISHNTINSILNNISKKIINGKDRYTTTTKIGV